jgi:pyroglutamyl-peptidase
MIVVTGFEPFAGHTANPSRELAKAVDGRRVGGHEVRGLVLPVQHREAGAVMERLLAERQPAVVVHLGLAEGRARIALERVALNVVDYAVPDNAGHRATGEPCVPTGPAAYVTTLPLAAILAALVAEGIPAYVSNTAGTYLCNETFYTTLHTIAARGLETRAGFVHLPLLPQMVAASGLEQPSMDLALMLHAVEVVLRVVA